MDIVFGTILSVFMLLALHSSILNGNHVQIDDYYFLSSRVVTKEKLEDGVECTDSDGNVVGDQGTWASADECETNLCFHAYSGIYVIKYVCRYPIESENPDPQNCEFVGNKSLVYPHCCEVLSCPGNQIVTTTQAPDCVDRSSPFACEVWKNSTYFDGCDPGSIMYNFTWVYCRSTCGFC